MLHLTGAPHVTPHVTGAPHVAPDLDSRQPGLHRVEYRQAKEGHGGVHPCEPLQKDKTLPSMHCIRWPFMLYIRVPNVGNTRVPYLNYTRVRCRPYIR